MSVGPLSGQALAQNGASPAHIDPSTLTPAQAAGLLMDGASTPEQRAAAAARLAAIRSDEGWDPLRKAMGPDAPEAAAVAAIGALAGLNDTGAPATIVSSLVRACEDSRWPVAQAAVVALGGLPNPSREAVSAAVRVMGRAQSGGQRAVVCAALSRMTGRDDLPAEGAAWEAWWREHGFLPEGEWRIRLANAQSARAQRLARERDALATRLSEVYGRVYALTRAEDRSAMLIAMLKDESTQVRLIGFDLASRALLNAQALDGSVADAAIESLASPSPDLRAASARLLANLAPREVAPAIAALRRETDDRVAAPLLRLLANRPHASETELCMRWLATSGPARPAAAEALGAMHRTTPLSPEVSARAIELLRRIDPSRISASSARLLGALGGASETEALLAVLENGEPAARLALAEGLASRDAGVDVLLSLAPTPDAATFEIVCRTLAARPVSPEMFDRFRRAGMHLGEAAHEGLARLLLAIPEDAFRRALEQVAPAETRNAVLARAAALAAPGAGEPAWRVGLARAEHALETRNGAGALETLDGHAATRDRADHKAARLAALLLLARLDEAETLHAPAAAWLRGLDLCRGLAHEPEIRDRIATLFESSLTDAERARLYAPTPADDAGARESADGAAPSDPRGDPGEP